VLLKGLQNRGTRHPHRLHPPKRCFEQIRLYLRCKESPIQFSIPRDARHHELGRVSTDRIAEASDERL
jgi:hypothetical protein